MTLVSKNAYVILSVKNISLSFPIVIQILQLSCQIV